MKRSSLLENAHRIPVSGGQATSGHSACPGAPSTQSPILVGENSGATQSRPFGDFALKLHERGLSVFPCGGEDGKTPLVRGWQKRHSAETITAWAGTFSDANIGLACGPSRIVIVDIDEPDLVEHMLERFGGTPLITRTPSGGSHLWYKTVDAVNCRNLRSEGLAVDIKADGGLVIVPTSFNRQSGKPYLFERGSWNDLGRLPQFRNEALARSGTAALPLLPSERQLSSGIVTEGIRDDAVFRRAMAEAPQAKSEGELNASMQRFNIEFCSPPIPARQVQEKVRSAWGYEQRGKNWIGHGRGGVVVNAAVIDDLLGRRHGEDALALLMKLKRIHGARAEPFAICCKAMARERVIAGWNDHRRYTRARKVLEDLDLIVCVSPASRDTDGRRTPALYRLCVPGAKNAPNITTTPSSLSYRVG